MTVADLTIWFCGVVIIALLAVAIWLVWSEFKRENPYGDWNGVTFKEKEE